MRRRHLGACGSALSASACFLGAFSLSRFLAFSLTLFFAGSLARRIVVVDVVRWSKDSARRAHARIPSPCSYRTYGTLGVPAARLTLCRWNRVQGDSYSERVSREKLLDDDTERLDHDDAFFVQALVCVELIAVDAEHRGAQALGGRVVQGEAGVAYLRELGKLRLL